jgi:hypothetical protein
VNNKLETKRLRPNEGTIPRNLISIASALVEIRVEHLPNACVDTGCLCWVFARGYTIHSHEREKGVLERISILSFLKRMLHEILCDNTLLYYSETRLYGVSVETAK